MILTIANQTRFDSRIDDSAFCGASHAIVPPAARVPRLRRFARKGLLKSGEIVQVHVRIRVNIEVVATSCGRHARPRPTPSHRSEIGRIDVAVPVFVAGDEIAYYDTADTTLAPGHLTSSGSIIVSSAAETTARLNFVLRTDGEPGGAVVLDNERVFSACPKMLATWC